MRKGTIIRKTMEGVGGEGGGGEGLKMRTYICEGTEKLERKTIERGK